MRIDCALIGGAVVKLNYRLLVYTLLMAGLLAFKFAQRRVDLSVVFGDAPCPRCEELHREWGIK